MHIVEWGELVMEHQALPFDKGEKETSEGTEQRPRVVRNLGE